MTSAPLAAYTAARSSEQKELTFLRQVEGCLVQYCQLLQRKLPELEAEKARALEDAEFLLALPRVRGPEDEEEHESGQLEYHRRARLRHVKEVRAVVVSYSSTSHERTRTNSQLEALRQADQKVVVIVEQPERGFRPGNRVENGVGEEDGPAGWRAGVDLVEVRQRGSPDPWRRGSGHHQAIDGPPSRPLQQRVVEMLDGLALFGSGVASVCFEF